MSCCLQHVESELKHKGEMKGVIDNSSQAMLFLGKSVSSNYTLLAAKELMNNQFNSKELY